MMAMLVALLPTLQAEKVARTGAEVGKWTMDYDAALKLAQQKNLKILLNFTGSDWCYWCKLMEQRVFSRTQWREYASKKLVLVTIDFPRDKSKVPAQYVKRNRKLQKKYKVRGYPTYILLNPKAAKVLARLSASRDAAPNKFIQEIEFNLRLTKKRINQYSKKLGPQKAKAYQQLIADYKKSKADLNAWIATRPRRTAENTKKLKEMLAKIEAGKQAIINFK